MVWIRRTRLTLLVGLLLAIAVLAWLIAHPGTYSGQLGRIITRNLLQESGAALTFETLRGNPFSDLTFYGVSLTRSGEDGSFLYLRADSLSVEYDLGSFLARQPHLQSVVLGPAQLLMREGRPTPPDQEKGPTPTVRPRSVVDVDYVRVEDLDVTVTSVAGSAVEEVHDLRWIGSLQTRVDQSLHLRAASLSGRWASRGLEAHQASFEARVRGRELVIEHATARLDSTDADLDLRLRWGREGGVDEMELDGTARDFSLTEIMTLLGKDPGPRLRLSGDARLRLREGRLDIEGSAEGWLESYPVAAREFRGWIDEPRLRFERIDGRFLSAHAQVSGDLDLDRDHLHLEGDVQGVDLSDPWTGEAEGWPRSAFSGEATVDLGLSPPLRLDLEARGLAGSFLDLPVDSLSGRLRYDEAEGVTVHESRARLLGATILGSGGVSLQEQVEMSLRGEADDLQALAAFFDLPLEGRSVMGAGRLYGPIDSLSLRVGGSAARLETAGFQARENSFVLALPRFDDLSVLDGELRAATTDFGTVHTGSLHSNFRRRGTRLELDQLEVVSQDSLLRARGRVDWSGPRPRVEVDSLYAETGADHWRLEEATEVVVLERGFSTPSLALRSATGRLALQGRFDLEEEIDLAVQMEDADLELLRRMRLLRAAVRGRADASLRFAGRLDSLRVDFDAEVDSAWVASRPLGQARLRGLVLEEQLELELLRAQGPLGRLEVTGQMRAPRRDWPQVLVGEPARAGELWRQTVLGLEIDTERLALAPLVEPGSPRSRFGELTVGLRLWGTPESPGVEGRIDVHGLETGTLTIPRLVAHLGTDERGLRVEEGSLRTEESPWLDFSGHLPLDLSFSRAPRWKSDVGVQLRLWSEGEVELAPFREFWPMARHLEGRGEILFEASGDPRAPRLSGHLRIRDGELGLQGWSENLREIEVEGRFEDDRLRVTRAEAREGAKGEVSAVGEVVFAGLLPDDVWADFRAHRVLVASVPYLRAIASSDDLELRLRRPSENAPRAPHITGHMVVDKAIYTGEFEGNGGAGQGALGPNLSPAWTAELAIQARDQVRISNQSAELRVVGDIDLIRDTNGLRFRGIAEIPRGRVPLFNNDFTITEGSLDFSRRPVEPEVDITAVTEVPLYDESGGAGRQLELITIHLTGTFAQPQVAFESESGLDENTILRLLAGFGGPESATAVSSGVGDLGLRAGLNFLERALAARVEGVDTIDIETEETGVEAMESTRIAVGKYISNNLYLRLSQGFSITERDLFLEYQISRRLLFTSELRRRLRENGAQNEFNVDLKFRVKY